MLLIGLVLLWGFLLFLVSRVLIYVISSMFSLLGFGIFSTLTAALTAIIFAALASYVIVRSLALRGTINRFFTPILVSLGLVVIAILCELIFNFIILGRIGPGYNLGILRFAGAVVGGYLYTLRNKPAKVN